MVKNKNRVELVREAQMAFMKGYAEDMDKWSSMREEQEEWYRESPCPKGVPDVVNAGEK